MRFAVASLLTLLFGVTASVPAHADQLLPQAQIDGSNNVKLGPITIGKWASGQSVLDISALLVTPSTSAPTGTISRLLLNALPSGRKAVEQGDGSDLRRLLPGTGTIARALSDIDIVSPVDWGADRSGTADALAKFNAAFADGRSIEVPKGVYNLSANAAPALPTLASGNARTAGTWIRTAPNATFPGAGYLSGYPAIGYQGTKIYANDLLSMAYGNTFDSFDNLFARGTHVECNTLAPCVAVFGQAHAATAGSHGFGGNFVAYAEGAGSGVQAIETDCGLIGAASGDGDVNSTQNGSAICQGIVATGFGKVNAGVQFQTNGDNTNYAQPYFVTGLNFNGRSNSGNFSYSLIGGGNVDPPYLVELSTSIARAKEVLLPSFSVAKTPTGGLNSRIEVQGGLNAAYLSSVGFATTLRAASGRITFTQNPAAGSTLTINGTTVTFVASGATGNQVNVGSSLVFSLINLQNMLNASTDANLSAASYRLSRRSILHITAKTAGAAGNAITYAASVTGASVDGSTMSYGSDAAAAPANVPLLITSAGTGIAVLGNAGNDQVRVNSGNVALRTGNTDRLVVSGTLATSSVPVALPAYTVATLPTCNTGNRDAMAVATDTNAPTYRGALTGGGAVRTPVYCDGASWTAH